MPRAGFGGGRGVGEVSAIPMQDGWYWLKEGAMDWEVVEVCAANRQFNGVGDRVPGRISESDEAMTWIGPIARPDSTVLEQGGLGEASEEYWRGHSTCASEIMGKLPDAARASERDILLAFLRNLPSTDFSDVEICRDMGIGGFSTGWQPVKGISAEEIVDAYLREREQR